MAFQADNNFCGFLRRTARSPDISESAPAANFLLDERIPGQREGVFLSQGPAQSPPMWDLAAWLSAFGNHFNEEIAPPARRAQRCSTFGATNQLNLLALESNQDVVRMESVSGLFNLAKTEFSTATELAEALRRLVSQRGVGGSYDVDERSRLERWVAELNRERDGRPLFVAPFGEVEPLLELPDWAVRVRNVLGLAHLSGTPAKPLSVVLMRYSLSRAERQAHKSKTDGWAAVPTVLEAGSHKGPNSAFFPFPRAAVGSGQIGFGATVCLGSDLDFKPEFLHFRIDYTLDDFSMVGEITDGVDDDQLADARRRHFDLLEQDLRFRGDVP
jgi:hypothetical protein